MRLSILAVAIGHAIVAATSVFGQEAVFLIRHAEKATGDDPPITQSGEARAARWGTLLADVEIEMVFTSTALRTRQTGVIVAGALGVPTKAIPASEVTTLTDTILFDHEDDRVLIVGHTETIPGILSALGVSETVEIADDGFSRMFVVVPRQDEGPVFLQMRMP